VKRFQILNATALVLAAWVAMGITVAGLLTRLPARTRDHYQREVAEFREWAGAYRRPMLFGDPLDGNAAVWYEQSFAHIRTVSAEELGVAVKGGFTEYPKTATAAIKDVCAEAESRRVTDALRCTHCDWGLSPDGVTSVENQTKARILGQCLTLVGHREAHRGARRAAVRAYFAGLALGCDLGRGDHVMTFIGMVSADTALRGLAELLASIDDHVVLDDVSRQLSNFEGSLPTGEPTLLYDRLWLDNMAQYRLWTTVAGWQVAPARNLLTEMAQLASDLQSGDRTARLDELEKRVDASRDKASETMRLHEDVLLLIQASQLVRLYRAVQTTILLQEWYMEHHRYPATAEQLGQPLDRFGIRYEGTKNGDGYKFIDLHPWRDGLPALIEHVTRRGGT
jgi:hypothetical protein